MNEIRYNIINKIFESTCVVENTDNKFGRTLTGKENEIRKFILNQTPVLGFIPQKKELLSNFKYLNEKEISNLLLKFNALDIIHLSEDDSTISAAYPFSNFRTKYLINFYNKNFRTVYAMCAIDALGIPFMFNSDITINSECFYSNEKIEIEIRDKQLTKILPEEVVVWYDMELSCCAATNQCKNLNFFSSKQNFNSWKTNNKNREGYLLNINEAFYLGKLFFNDRLK